MRLGTYAVIAFCGLISSQADAQNIHVPYSFQSGTPAQAAQVNANFQSVDTRINNSLGGIIRWLIPTYSDTGVASATCPANSLVASNNCWCDYVNGTRNIGVLAHCSIAGNGGVAGCLLEYSTYNPAKPSPRAQMTLVCLAARKNNGEDIVPVPVTSGADGGLQKIDRQAADELEAAAKAALDLISDQAAQLQQSSAR